MRIVTPIVELQVLKPKFQISHGKTPEEHGWDEADVVKMLKLAEEDPNNVVFKFGELANDIGMFYEDGVLTDVDIQKAIFWYERAVARGNDLAMCNLGDIYREGKGGVPVDRKRAYYLYRDSRLPYAYFRMGECYERGIGIRRNKERAKVFYRVAYQYGNPQAKKKLKEWDFLH